MEHKWHFRCLNCPGHYEYYNYPDFEWTCPACGNSKVLVTKINQ